MRVVWNCDSGTTTTACTFCKMLHHRAYIILGLEIYFL